MEVLHRHLIRFIAIDIMLLVLLLATIGTSGSSTILAFYMILGLILIPLGVISVISMQKRARMGINLGIASLALTGAAFLLLGTVSYTHLTLPTILLV